MNRKINLNGLKFFRRDIIENSLLTRESSENSLDRLIIMISTFFYEKPERNLYREFL